MTFCNASAFFVRSFLMCLVVAMIRVNKILELANLMFEVNCFDSDITKMCIYSMSCQQREGSVDEDLLSSLSLSPANGFLNLSAKEWPSLFPAVAICTGAFLPDIKALGKNCQYKELLLHHGLRGFAQIRSDQLELGGCPGVESIYGHARISWYQGLAST